jgi:hypothetical protein
VLKCRPPLAESAALFCRLCTGSQLPSKRSER